MRTWYWPWPYFPTVWYSPDTNVRFAQACRGRHLISVITSPLPLQMRSIPQAVLLNAGSALGTELMFHEEEAEEPKSSENCTELLLGCFETSCHDGRLEGCRGLGIRSVA